MESFLHDIAAIAAHPYIAVIILTALAFDYVNGFHDAANSIATIVGTRVMRPGPAVVWAAFWNFAALWFFGYHVANTIAKMVHVEFVSNDMIFGGLLGAIIWNLITWYGGLPSSSSHALMGGLCGAAIAGAGKFHGVLHEAIIWRTIKFIVVAPVLGMVLGLILITILFWALRYTAPRKVDRWFRVIQLGSAAMYSMGHGTNDAQKTMGVIAALLFASIWTDRQADFISGHAQIPYWIAVVCFLTISLGTMGGGWRIVKTMGMKITKLKPHGGACAETAAAITLFMSSNLGIPVSTTHTITGAIIGVGSVQRLSAVRWGVARNVVWAWILTIPASATVGAIVVYTIKFFRSFGG